MRTVALFSVLLVLGMIGSQSLPFVVGDAYGPLAQAVQLATMIALAFIMIHVGYEFDLDKSRLGQYGWDYVVAMTAAAFPWIFACLYFVLVMMPADFAWQWQAWKESLLASRFAAPTSAGVLFAMLAAAGLSATWVFQKARVLAIFDDVDTVLLMIPLQMLMVGLAWQLGVVVVVLLLLVWFGWRYLHAWRIPATWPWVLGYSVAIAGLSEWIYLLSKQIDYSVPLHIEVLLPAFILGSMMARPAGANPHEDDRRAGHQEGPESPREQRAAMIVSAVFMVLVGLSMPPLFGPPGKAAAAATLTASMPSPAWPVLALHVVAITVLSNLGKMFPALCYRREASLRERLAIAVALWPRGEVGAGVLILSLGYGLGGPIIIVAMLSLALNLVLTGVFILIVKRLVERPY